jgi:pilus assembly protein CpaB
MRAAVRARISVAAGVTLGALLLAFGAYRVSHDAKPKAKPVAAPVMARLLVATRDVARGETLSAGDIATLPIQGEAPLGAMTAPGQVVGRIAVNDIAARRLILAGDVSADAGAAGLSLLVKPGYRAITLDANDEIAVGSFLRPGDRVDVEVVLPAQGPGGVGQSRAWLTDVDVLAVGAATGAGAAAPSSATPGGQGAARTVTLALTPDQVSRFVLARSSGRIFLTLRNPSDHAQPAQAPAPLRRTRTASASATAAGPIEVVVEGRREVLYPGADRQ